MKQFLLLTILGLLMCNSMAQRPQHFGNASDVYWSERITAPNGNIPIEAVSDSLTCYPATNLRATVVTNGGPYVALNWDEPQHQPSLLYWDNGVNNGGIGFTSGGMYIIAQRFTPVELAEYDGYSLTKVAIFPNDYDSDYWVTIFTGVNAGTMVLNQEITPICGQWNEITLKAPIAIDITQELWIGCRINQSTGPGMHSPAGSDSGPCHPGFGDMISMDSGVTWTTLSSSYGILVNWSIHGFVTKNNETNETPLPDQQMVDGLTPNLFMDPLAAGDTKNCRSIKTLLGFNVYRNGEALFSNPVHGLQIIDFSVSPGNEYEYFVTSIYSDSCNSEPSNTVVVDVPNGNTNVDVSIVNITSPFSGENLGMEDVSIVVANNGDAVQSNIPVFYTINGNNMVFETIPDPIQPGNLMEYTFSVQADLSEVNTVYNIEACTYLQGDNNPTNDCQSIMVTNFAVEHPEIDVNPAQIMQVVEPETVTVNSIIISNNGNAALDYNLEIGASGGGSGLCTDNLYTGGCSYGDGIVFWEFANINVPDIPCSGNPSWYHDYTDKILNLTPGESYMLTIKSGSMLLTYFDVWIDFNDDLTLTNDEIIVDDGVLEPGTIQQINVPISEDATIGTHILRVRTKIFEPVTNPCTSYDYGNCLDFTATITGGSTPTEWLSADITSGTIEPGGSQEITLTFDAEGLENGTYEKAISITSNDPENPVVEVPVTMNVMENTQPWDVTVTEKVHFINVPASANPNIYGEPLVEGDWVGVFFVDDNGNESCGGAAMIDAFGNAVVLAYGDDDTTPGKDGFSENEIFRWKLFDASSGEEFPAGATYDPDMSNQGLFVDLGLSQLTGLSAMNCQYYSFSQGWNSISSYITPSDPDVEPLFSPLGNKLIAVNNLTSIYWPAVNLNTIGNFDNTSGYALKVAEDVGFDVCGINYSNNALTLDPGWHYMPVLSECDVNTMDLFGNNLSDIIIVQDLIGYKVFWPEMDIYTLEMLEPGKAYKIKVANEFTTFFPECNGATVPQTSVQVNSIPTLWGEMEMTPATQLTAILHSALTAFIDGDVIGAFGQNDQLYGYMTFDHQGQNQAITLFGDDATSADQAGFKDGEAVTFKLLRMSTGETFDLEVEYDQMMENSSGNYQSGSMAAIKNIVMNSNGTGLSNSGNIEIYPNPAHDELSIKINNMESGLVSVSIFDSRGQKIIDKTFSNKIDLNVSTFSGGVYYLKLQTGEFNEVRKIVIK